MKPSATLVYSTLLYGLVIGGCKPDKPGGASDGAAAKVDLAVGGGSPDMTEPGDDLPMVRDLATAAPADLSGAGPAQWYFTCGDPVCHGHTIMGFAPCTAAQVPGQACSNVGTECDPGDACNRRVRCDTADPTRLGCPKSRRSLKQDIEYVSPDELSALYDEVRRMKLATWRYKWSPPDSPRRLGFLIDDDERGKAVDPERDMVDLYGYTSLAVAALQTQAHEIEALKREVSALRAELKSRRGKSK